MRQKNKHIKKQWKTPKNKVVYGYIQWFFSLNGENSLPLAGQQQFLAFQGEVLAGSWIDLAKSEEFLVIHDKNHGTSIKTISKNLWKQWNIDKNQ